MDPQLLNRVPDGEVQGTAAGLFRATVRAVTHRAVGIEHPGGAGLARRAASCLLAPQAGDAVLCSETEGTVYVIAVLEREGTARTIEVEGDLRVRSREGSVEVHAPVGDVALCAGDSARVAAKKVSVAAQEEGSWVGRELRMLGEHLSMSATRISQESELAERVAASLRERLGRVYRDIEEEEHVRAGSLTTSVRHLMRTHAETAITTAKKLIKLDGDQIHLG